MKKRILSCLMALALCLTLLPAAALAEETEGTAQTSPAVEEAADPANGKAKQENQPAEQEEQQEDSAVKQDEAVAAVQAMIDALPDAKALDGMDDEALDAVYEAFQTACGAYYDTLTVEQQAQLKNTEKLAALSDWFNAQVAPLTEGSTAMTVSINKVALSAAAPYFPSNGTAAQAEKPDDNYAWFNAETSTLELHNFALDSGGIMVVSTVKNDPLTIALYGENTLSDGEIYVWNGYLENGAIYLTIEKSADAPSGSLSVTCSGNKWATIMSGDLTVRGGAQVNLVKKDGSGDTGNCGINADGYNVIIEGEGTKLDITNTETDKARGIRAKDVTVRDGASVAIAAPNSRALFDPEGSSGMTATTLTVAKGTTVQGSFDGTTYRDITDYLNTAQMYVFPYLKISAAPVENHAHAIGVGTEYGDSSEVAFAHSLTSDSDKNLLLDGRVVKHEQIPYSQFDGYKNNHVFVLPEGNYYLEDDISLMYPLAVTGEVNLCLNGKQIIQNYTYGKGMRFPTVIVRRDATLNLGDCRPEGAVGKITHASDLMGSGIEVRGKFKDVTGEAGVLNLYNAEISGNKQTSAGAANGGGVNNKGVFNMYGGKITGNAHTNGGGVGNSGTFTMYAGEITGNTANDSSFAEGGGVYSYGTFIMRGGSITGNHANIPGASYNIGGISNRGTFLVSGKVTISGNDGSNFFVNEEHLVQVDGKLDPSSVISLDMFQGTGSYKKDEVKIVVKGVTDENEGVFKKDRDAWNLTRIDGDKLVLHTTEKVHYHPVCGATCTHLDENGAPKHPNVLWEPTATLPKYAGNYYLTQNIDLTSTWTVPANIVLDLNGRNITQTSSKNDIAVIEVPANKSFTLTDCHTDDNNGGETRTMGSVKHEYAKQSGRGVVVKGNFTLYNGGITTNNCSTNYPPERLYSGAGVYVDGGGSFTMYGGKIAENIAMNGAGVYVNKGGSAAMSGGTITGNNAAKNGGGVAVNGTFTMSGGAITGNNAAKNGGGVAVNGTFTMSGGEITGNTASGYGDGGGVYVNYDGTFQMSDDSRITGNTGYRGGGVSVERSYSTTNNPGAFTMSSGRITDNNAQYGGGVYISGNFTMSGGEISSNKATGNSGGVHMNTDSTFTVSGAPKITGNTLKNSTTNNVRLSKGTTTGTSPKPDATITIGDAHLSTGASIGVTTDKTLTTGSSVTIATGAISGDEKYFTSDADRDYHFVLDGNEVKLGQHEHNWQYTLSEDKTTITAKCTAEGCSLAGGLGGTLTLIPPQNSTYDGTPKAVKLDSTLDSSITKPKIMYQQGEAVLNTDPPTDAGTYTASIKLTGADGQTATASVEYTIAKATPTVDNFTFTAPSTADLIYNGNAKIAAVKAKDGVTGMGNITVKYFKDDEPVNEAKEVGNYTVKISMDDTGNNYHATTEDLTKGEWKFTIGKGTQTVNVPTGKTIVKNGREVDISDWATVSGVEGGKTPGTLSYTLIGNPVGITLADNKLKADPGTTESAFEIKATAAATNDYNEASQTFTVTVTDKKPANLSVSMTGWTYGESANKPGYTVPEGVTATVTYGKADGTALSERPTDAGNYTVKVQYETDTNIYTGTAEFTISKREIAVPTADPMQFEYTGQEQTYVLSNFADASYYTVSNTMKRTDAGSQNVTVQLNDKSNTVWEDGTDEDKTYVFTIAPKPLSKVTIGDFPDKTYTGLSIQPAVAPVDGNTALTENTDYTVSYGANTNVGKATITVTGTGNYTGTVSKEWKITPAVLTISGVTVVDKTYNGSADATVTAVAFNGLKNGEELVIGTDYEVHGAAFNDENVDAANKVTGTVALKNTEKTKNYTLSSATFEQAAAIGRADYNGTASTTINIVKGRSTAQTGTLTAADFFPEGQMPADAAIVSVTPNSGTIIESIAVDGTNHKLDYVSKTNIAAAADESYTVTIATTNYKDITATLTFHPTDKLVQDGFKFENGSVTKTYGDEDFTLTTIGEVKGSTVTYESSEPAVAAVDSATGKVTIKGAGTAVITAKAAATDEYDEAVATCTLTVEKKLIAIPAADATVFTYNGKPQTYALVENEAYTVSGNVQTDANETGYSVKAALKDTANTQWADGMTADKTYTFVIGKAVITVTAKDQTAYVGDKAPELGEDSYTVSGLVGEEKLTTQPTVKYVDADGNEIAPDMTKTGEVKILADGAVASGNYTIRYKDGKLTVSTRPSSGSSSRPSTHPVQTEVRKDPDGSVSLSKTSAAKGDKVTITVKPDRHYKVDEVIVRDSKGKQLAVKDNGDGTYTFEMPADKVTVEPTFTWVNPFADVANNAYYVDAVEWMLKREVTQGTTETTFSPNLNCTRAQIVTFLWRAAGSPEPKGTVSFADVPAGSYYAKAVAWAIENGITGGTGDGLFSPNAACTRAQSAAFLYRAAGSPAVGGSSGFSDVAADAYYAQAVAWAVENGITTGVGNGHFDPTGTCTRAQIAAFLYRYMK